MPKKVRSGSIKAALVVLDFGLYPRHRINDTHVRELVLALEAGATLPPIRLDNKTKRAVDGFHRVTAALRHDGADAEIEAEFWSYASEGEVFQDAMAQNAVHGERLGSFDKARCLLRGQELGLERDVIASALSITPVQLSKLEARKVSYADKKPVPIKLTMRHLAGKDLTPQQVKGNAASGGGEQLFYVNQVINLLENDSLDEENQALLERLRLLARLLEARFAITA